MPIRGVVSSLSDQKYIAALEKDLEDKEARIQALEGYIKNIGRAS